VKSFKRDTAPDLVNWGGSGTRQMRSSVNRRHGRASLGGGIKEDHARPSATDWNVSRLVDERTGDTCLGVDFPRRLHGRGFEVIDDDLAEQPGKVRARLKKRGAAFEGTKKRQIRFVMKLLNRVAPEPLILAMKPGFRSDGFILGNCMLGNARGKFRWKPDVQHLGAADIGDTHGDRDAWVQDVGKVSLKSFPLSCGLLVGLASCVPSYIEWHMKSSPELKPLISETATFNFEGESGSGKTNIVRAAAGLVGPPDLIGRWDFTRRGLEEQAESRNDLPMVLDDTETHLEHGVGLITALRYVTQVIPKRASKHIAKVAEKSDLPPLAWSNFGLTTSPPNLEKAMASLGWKRTEGEKVRFISMPVRPVGTAGIFDQVNGSKAERIEKGKVLTDRLERGVAQNYGLIYPPWIKYLLASDRSKELVEFVAHFVSSVAGHSNGWETRYARKFGVLYAVGRLAVKAGILPWPRGWAFKATARCYHRSIRAIRSEQVLAARAIKMIADLSTDPARFVRMKPSAHRATRLGNRTLGLRTRYRGRAVLAVRDQTLRSLAGSQPVAKIIIDELKQQRLLVGGHGRRRTTQLPVPVKIANKTIQKPRFWVIDRRRLLDYVKAKDQKD
jgi:hypothetical protein